MLDEGGPTKEAEIYALNAMRAARSEDDKLTKQLNDEVKSYEEAVKSIKKALATSGGTPLTPARKAELATLLKAYEKRLANVKEAARALAAVKPPLPKTTPEEDDACAILWVKLIGKKTDKPPIMSS
ncbi:hypothetical protein JL721_10359 [Aureococcus anophagefferens]|nr:hypothetical protein JL721_10359 [Aureococcus anophagefferens]KAH8060461.1 hypothetical protein JL722_4558 [Aureococcus anophagefferens]